MSSYFAFFFLLLLLLKIKVFVHHRLFNITNLIILSHEVQIPFEATWQSQCQSNGGDSTSKEEE